MPTHHNADRLTYASKEDTVVLPQMHRGAGGAAFCAFLHLHRLTIVDVAIAGKMRLLPIWRLAHDQPIRLHEAQSIRETLYRLAGTHFTAPIPIVRSEWQGRDSSLRSE